VVPSEPPELSSKSLPALRDNQKAAYLALSEALTEPLSQDDAGDDDPTAIGLSVEAAIGLVKGRLEGVNPKRLGERAKAAITTLVKEGLLSLEHGRLTLPVTSTEQ